MAGQSERRDRSGPSRTVLVTGASGYIGGRLVPRLLAAGHRVRCLARSSRKLAVRDWSTHPHLQIFEGDVSEMEPLTRAMEGCESAYYLIHSMMTEGHDFRGRDRTLAAGFALAADRAGLGRIIYLGGLGETGPGLSEHLASRREVEMALASGSVPVTVFRAAMIIGSGSASFEILRYLVERLPVMVTPRWVSTQCQPIAVQNVLNCLVDCLGVPETIGKTLDIGGPDILTYRELMDLLAEVLELPKRVIVPVPVLTPRLSSLWIHLVTPLDRHIARPLAEGLRNRVVCRDNEALLLMPQDLLSVRKAFEAAIEKGKHHHIETSWTDAGAIPGDPDWAGGTVFIDRKEVEVSAPPENVYAAVCRIGGDHGYYSANWLWRLRGWMDHLIGGPGLRRGRKDPEKIGYGEALDFWRVVGIERNCRLDLRAEMKLPGEAMLHFEIEAIENRPDHCRLRQIARFKPKGLLGLLYWYATLPLHGFVFRAMLSGIRRTAERSQATDAIGRREENEWLQRK